MAFTGKATYSAGTTLPELAEDVSDLVAIVSPYETPLLDALGDPLREAASTHHEWMEGDFMHGNPIQLFTATVKVRSSDMAASQLGLADEMDYQKQERLRELLRDLENAVINGVAQDQKGMNGILHMLRSHVVDAAGAELTEERATDMLRSIWETSSGNIDLIVVGGYQKRAVNAWRLETDSPSGCGVYESDFGTCRIVMTRWLPQDAALFLDSSRISVLPLAGRSFHFKPLASGGDYECGELIGEYTLELKNEAAHGLIRDLSTSGMNPSRTDRKERDGSEM